MTAEQRLLLGALGLALVVGAVAALPPVERPEIIVAAAISVVGTFVTVLSGWLLFRAQTRAEATAKARDLGERRRRILIALRAEVFETVKAHAAQYGPGVAGPLLRELTDRVDASDPPESGMPKAVVVKEAPVFEAVKRELADLPPDVIAPVLRFHYSDEFATEFLSEISRGTFDTVSPERRKAMLVKLFDLGRAAIVDGITAFGALDAALPDADAAEMRDRIAALDAALVRSADDDGGEDAHAEAPSMEDAASPDRPV